MKTWKRSRKASREARVFYDRLVSAWSAETSSNWSIANPAKGQCSVTALIAQDVFGGEILKTHTPGGTHFYNLIDGVRWDFTVSQFDRPIPSRICRQVVMKPWPTPVRLNIWHCNAP